MNVTVDLVSLPWCDTHDAPLREWRRTHPSCIAFDAPVGFWKWSWWKRCRREEPPRHWRELYDA